ncbi:hypothetical protein DSUL_260022 [Desulfovibrionales bacterium]
MAQAIILTNICRRTWERGLFAGTNGNISLRMGNTICITCHGAAKGDLGPNDLLALDLRSGCRLHPNCTKQPSAEAAMRLAVYNSQPKAGAVLHTHPPHLLALELIVPPKKFLYLPTSESEAKIGRLNLLSEYWPDSSDLAKTIPKVLNTRALQTQAKPVPIRPSQPTPLTQLATATPPNHLCRRPPDNNSGRRQPKSRIPARHGLVCWGRTPAEALAFTEELDHLAHIQLLVRQARED